MIKKASSAIAVVVCTLGVLAAIGYYVKSRAVQSERSIRYHPVTPLPELNECKSDSKECKLNWKALYNFRAKTNAFAISVNFSRKAYRVGEQMHLTVNAEKDGKVWILYVDPNDVVSQLVPNSEVKDNRIKAGVDRTFPGNGARWSIEAEPPIGNSIFAVIVTTEDAKPGDILAGTSTSIEHIFKQTNTKGLISAVGLVEKNTTWALVRKLVIVEAQ